VTLSVRNDRHYIRTGYRSNRFLLVELVAPSAPRRDTGRPPVNLAFVLDRSGSMSGAKMETARQAVEDAIARLSADDRFAVVVYDDQIDVVAESLLASPDNRRRAVESLARVDARNSTNLGEGWLRGCEQVARHLVEKGVNRTLLLTDGLANVGITDPSELERHASELRQRGVATSTFGVGADFDEHLLQAMADAGGGHFYFIESAAQIRDHMTSEVGESLEVVARGAEVVVDAPEGVTVEALGPWRATSRPGSSGSQSIAFSLGDLVAEQRVSVVLRLNFPHGHAGDRRDVTVRVADRDDAFVGAKSGVTFEYADDRTNDLQPRDRDVDRAVARSFAARVRQEALVLNRQGRYDEAAARLDKVAKRIRTYANGDSDMMRIVAELEQQDRVAMAAPMAPMAAKQRFFESSAALHSRSPEGRAQR
jgi:Ca-activated chloride channel family protein